MQEIRGTISEKDLEKYEGANILIMEARNGSTGSGFSGSLNGEGTYTWSLSWDENGFTGVNWKAFSGYDLTQDYSDISTLIEEIRSDPVTYAVSVATTNREAYNAGCASATLIS